VTLFVREIEKIRKRARDRGNEPFSRSNQFIHLHLDVPFFASYLNKLHQNTGSEEDYGVNLLSLSFKFVDMYKGFITVYEEMFEKYTLWVTQIAQNEEIPQSPTNLT